MYVIIIIMIMIIVIIIIGSSSSSSSIRSITFIVMIQGCYFCHIDPVLGTHFIH